MSTYLFHLGTNPLLSLSEIWNRYDKPNFNWNGGDYAFFSLDCSIDQAEFDQLGGSIKVAQVISVVSKEALVSSLANELQNHYLGSKLDYGLSLYGIPETQLRSILLKLKKQLRSKGVKSRFINHQFKNISAAQYKSIKEKGVELIVAKKEGEWCIGKVLAVQDIDAYSKRDYQKPFRNMKMGMMPPKMAQILINIASSESVWDPFCGSGTLLIEGLLMGKKVWGSDINSKHVEGAQLNIDWLKKEWGIKSLFDLQVHDATQPLKVFDLSKIKAIAFEGDLGVPHGQDVDHEFLNKIIVQLTGLYVSFFHELKQASFDGVVVCALPYFKTKGGKDIMMDRLIEQVKKMGFKNHALLPNSFSHLKRFCIKYSREGQSVGRAIYKFSI